MKVRLDVIEKKYPGLHLDRSGYFFILNIPYGGMQKGKRKNHAESRTPGRMLFYFIGNCVL